MFIIILFNNKWLRHGFVGRLIAAANFEWKFKRLGKNSISTRKYWTLKKFKFEKRVTWFLWRIILRQLIIWATKSKAWINSTTIAKL